ncbi:MAG: DUF2442 domain-containing protein [Candidatus Latescibacteria bacterium]|nr:DUF2442 domain-containing protein [Candidatus Latescibacterota bacterium]
MSTATQSKPRSRSARRGDPCFERIEVTDTTITAHLSDGRTVSVPLWWSWRLEQAARKQRRNYEIIGAGRIAHWPEVDEHLSLDGFLTGTPAPRPKAQRQR